MFHKNITFRLIGTRITQMTRIYTDFILYKKEIRVNPRYPLHQRSNPILLVYRRVHRRLIVFFR